MANLARATLLIGLALFSQRLILADAVAQNAVSNPFGNVLNSLGALGNTLTSPKATVPASPPPPANSMGTASTNQPPIVRKADGYSKFDDYLKVGDYSNAKQFAMTSGGVNADGSARDLLWALEAGAVLLYAGDANTAVHVLDNAEKLMGDRDNSTLSGQYNYTTYDAIMDNSYTALAFFLVGNFSDARVEFNRVRDRQARAEEQFRKEKEKLDQSTQAAEKQPTNVNLAGTLQEALNSPQYKDEQAELQKYANYKPFINPFAGYLTGIFLVNSAESGDAEKARTEFVRVRDMVGKNPTIQADLALSETFKGDHKPRTWVIFEDGQAPILTENRITIPVPIIGTTNYASTITIAFPRMVFNPSAYQTLIVTAGSQRAQTYSVGSFESVAATEFQARLQGIVQRSVVEAAVKIGIQYGADQVKGIAGTLLKLGTAVVANVSSADTRSWTALPKDFQAARIDTPADGVIHVSAPNGQELGSVKVGADHSSIVYVKAVSPGGKISTQVFSLMH